MFLVTKFGLFEVVSQPDEHGRSIRYAHAVRAKSRDDLRALLAAIFPTNRGIEGPLLPDTDDLMIRVSVGPRPRIFEFAYLEFASPMAHGLRLDDRMLSRVLRTLVATINYSDTGAEVSSIYEPGSEYSTLVHRVIMHNRLRIAKRKFED